ncbi:acyl carrier protein 3, chloroplastic-like [Phragmites australis]|uniref:acyl carrier protein 3, chloroplastic-like n=1 Tax=Phragmites australis TaxID=29695 RepID=UPI002D7988A5|nr:acyl carrier protein 3, chloroplastic-like [Phragmites australis]
MVAPVTAAAARSAILAYSPARRVQGMDAVSFRVSASFVRQRASSPSIRLQRIPKRFQVSCSAKQETIEKVCEIVKNQLAVEEGTPITGETKFVDLGADSLDTVEIVMGLEEAFQITVDESSAQVIQTVEDAAALIDKLVAEKGA